MSFKKDTPKHTHKNKGEKIINLGKNGKSREWTTCSFVLFRFRNLIGGDRKDTFHTLDFTAGLVITEITCRNTLKATALGQKRRI
jgi:hypothetical protein